MLNLKWPDSLSEDLFKPVRGRDVGFIKVGMLVTNSSRDQIKRLGLNFPPSVDRILRNFGEDERQTISVNIILSDSES
jgi:hypothetical protein